MHSSTSLNSPYQFRTFIDGVKSQESEAFVSGESDKLFDEAKMSVCEMIRDLYGQMKSDTEWRLEVTDRLGKVIGVFSFTAAMPDRSELLHP